MVTLSNLLLGDKVIKDHQERLSQIDTTNSAQLNATIATTLISSDYIELCKNFYLRKRKIIVSIATSMKYISPALLAQQSLYMTAKDKFFDFSRDVGVAEFVGYVVLALLLFGGFWYQSRKGLGNRIRKSKRMLNIMPMEFVLGNELLKERVLSQEIQRVLA